MSAASELREAAKLMRERAEPCDQGPWIVVPSSALATARVDGADWTVCRAHDNEAVHIASWHPLVALAMANWLDIEAGILEKDLPDPTGGWAEARAVARAYMGSGG